MSDAPDEARCSCGMHATVFGEVPDPGCPIHGELGINAWSTCFACGRNVRHAVGHECEARAAWRVTSTPTEGDRQ